MFKIFTREDSTNISKRKSKAEQQEELSYWQYDAKELTDQLKLLVVILEERKKDVKRNHEMETKEEGQEH